MPAIDSINTVAKDLVSQISSLVPGLDSSIVTTIILPMILIILGAVLIYDLYILYQALSTAASLNSSRSLMSPMILKAAKDVLGLKDEITFDTLLQSRSLESFSPILNGIQMAMDKYAHQD